MNLLEKGKEATQKVLEGANVATKPLQAPAGVIDKAIEGTKKIGTETKKGLDKFASMSKQQQKAEALKVKQFRKTYIDPVTKPIERKVAVAMALNSANQQRTEENSR